MSEIITDYEVAIVGGGPGGLTAGLYCARGMRKTIVFEKYIIGGQIANTDLVEDYPGFESIDGRELADKMSAHAKSFGVETVADEVTDIWDDGALKMVSTASGKLYQVKAVILSTGGTPNKLGVEGEERLYGKGVSYCAICDGAFFKGQVLAVVGGGDAALEEGGFLTKYATKVFLIHRRDAFRAAKIVQERAKANPKLEIIYDSVVESINGENRVESVTVKNVKTGDVKDVPVGGVFPFIGFTPNSNVTRVELKKDSAGYIITDDHMQTSTPGIFACGDVRSQLVRQITNAVGDGTTAAVAAERHMESIEDKMRVNA